MNFILLTQSTTPVIGQVAWVLGKIMNGIFFVIDLIGLPNIGLAIILFTIVVNLLMTPLNIKQQKFSKLQVKMSPEIQAIEAKYKGKSDQNSMMAKNQEIQMIYAKYGVSASGSCVQLIIQMPILFALYQVIQRMPAYVTKIGETFRVLADKIISVDGGGFLQDSGVDTIVRTVSMYGQSMTKGDLSNGIIDVLNRLSSTDLAMVAEHYDLTQLTYQGKLIISNDVTRGLIDVYNNFLGLHMGDSPSDLIKRGMEAGAWGIVIGAVLIPVLSAVTQWINVKLMPQQPKSDNEKANSMAASMKTMNMFMPLMSAWFCFTLPAGMGLYWVAGSVVRSIQQVLINKHIDKMDFEEVIKKNSAKSAKKLEKMKQTQERMNAYATIKGRNIQSTGQQNGANISTNAKPNGKSMADKASVNASAGSVNTGRAKPGSMLEKANLVKDYNERNNKN
ncbi:MAG: YidC/Oxa1 family membrane protein insertase [Lachnospiraceae bacterium]|jgi:YidC/Oxa1 family membrane protein insertase|nr:YidC/Oxa1 family membrane protein insertase [uncultured Acetatifactor sp.]MCI9219968.1 YidC/Oxa1 family membrane protein insertase [Lachnospiraceae bacterium]